MVFLRRTPYILLVALCLSGCGRPEPQPLIFNPPPWKAGEVSEYRITDVNSQPAGTARYEIGLGEEPNEGETWALRREIASQGVTETVTVSLDERLRPITSLLVRTLGPQRGQEVVKATYNSGQVEMELTTAQSVTTNQRVSIPSDARDGYMLLPLVRALPLQERYTTRLFAFLPLLGQVETYLVTVRDSEEVVVPAGSFTTYKVELSTSATKTTAWYTQDALHTLVKYVDGRNSGTFELTGFQPGK